MSADHIMAIFLSIWFGFAFTHYIHSQSAQDKILTSLSGNSGWWRLAVARFIFFVTGMLGAIGLVLLMGSMPVFKGPVFPVGLLIGIVLFWLTGFLKRSMEKINGD